MITKLMIQNYRSCRNTLFNVHSDLSVLIGPNGSGKTNVLSALLLLKKLLRESDYRYENEQPTGQSDLKVWFEMGTRRAILTATINTYTDESNRDVVVSSKQHWHLKDSTGDEKYLTIPLALFSNSRGIRPTQRHFFFPRPLGQRTRYAMRRYHQTSESARNLLTSIAGFLAEMKYYSASQFTNPSRCPVSFEIEKEGERFSGALRPGGHTRFLHDLYTSHIDRDTSGYQQFLDIIGQNGIGLVDKIRFKEVLTSSVDVSVRSGGKVRRRRREKILVVPQFTVGRHNLSPNQLSEGTFKTITLLFYLVTESSTILLIEEPEVCVHQGLLSSIIELIKQYSRDKQILVSTHSDFVLDKVGTENVYKVSNSATHGTKVVHIHESMSKRELSALKQYLDTEGNLGEYWKHGGLE